MILPFSINQGENRKFSIAFIMFLSSLCVKAVTLIQSHVSGLQDIRYNLRLFCPSLEIGHSWVWDTRLGGSVVAGISWASNQAPGLRLKWNFPPSQTGGDLGGGFFPSVSWIICYDPLAKSHLIDAWPLQGY